MNAERAEALTLGDRRREADHVLAGLSLERQPGRGVDRWIATWSTRGYVARSTLELTPQGAIASLRRSLRELGADEADL